MSQHEGLAPQRTIREWSTHLPADATVLDVAAGGGRHALLFAERGHRVTAVDRDVTALRGLDHPNIEVVAADLEGAPWPFADRSFDAAVVVNYLWRPLMPDLLASIATGGLLLYETFAVGNERFGRPRNPDFLLQPDELRQMVGSGFEVLDYWHGEVGQPPTAVRQRLLGRRR